MISETTYLESHFLKVKVLKIEYAQVNSNVRPKWNNGIFFFETVIFAARVKSILFEHIELNDY